ncbi:MAG: peptidyl-tRNA hydrolase Pth2 [Candidatus Micrarchaeaceae archaeon]
MQKSSSEEIKQVIVVRSDLGMGKGKLAAQVAHASLESYLLAAKKDAKIAEEWVDSGQKKIVLKVDGEESLVKLFKAFEYLGVPCALISDAGLTELPPGTRTALGIGPWKAVEIDKYTSSLKLM